MVHDKPNSTLQFAVLRELRLLPEHFEHFGDHTLSARSDTMEYWDTNLGGQIIKEITQSLEYAGKHHQGIRVRGAEILGANHACLA